jgi:TolB-like protein/DNA-binding winged helix-turn-helix (wHTH) protein
MASVDKKIFSFESYTLDLKRGCLHREGREIELRPKSFAVLRHLVENAGQLIEKDELIRSIWSNVIVTDEALTRCISEVRLALGADGSRLIKTVPRRGYLLDTCVAAAAGRPHMEVIPQAATSILYAGNKRDLPPRLSIVVLPFADLGGTGGQGHFVDAVAEALTTNLSRLRGATVTARNTALTYRGKAADVRQIGRELGVRFVVEGSVQAVKDRVRVSAQLVDSLAGSYLWAERFDMRSGDPLEAQDIITARLARSLGVEIVAAESLRAGQEHHDRMDAFDFTLRGKAIWNRPPSLQRAREARAQFEAALRLDNKNVGALIGIAKAYAFEVHHYGSGNPDNDIRAAEAALMNAMALSPDNLSVRLCRAHLLCLLRRPEEALWEYETLAGAGGSRPSAHAHLGLLKLLLGRAEETEVHVAAAMRLSPHDPWSAQWHFYLGAADLYVGRVERAVDRLRRAVSANPGVALYRLYLAAALALEERQSEAVEMGATARVLLPDLSIGKFRNGGPSRNKVFLDQRERAVEGMRRAGIPE